MQEKPQPNIEQRRQKILDLLALEGIVRVTPLSRELGVTPVTVRSDLEALEKEGLISRTQGGAVPKVQGFRSPSAVSPARAERKRQIAEGLAEHVQDGETLLINSGTTTLCAAIALKRKQNLSVVTNSVAIASELSAEPGFRVILLGGEFNAQFGFSYGADAQEQLARYKADKAILSIDGIRPTESGLTTYHAQEALLDRMMMQRAEKTLVLADHTKFGRESFSVVDGIQSVDCILTNRKADEGLMKQIRGLGVEVVQY